MLDKEILLVLASETGRNCAVLPPEFAPIVVRKLKRKFKIKVTAEEITSILDGYVSIYLFAASALKECLRPVRGEYASLADIDGENFIIKLANQFPTQDDQILSEIAAWVIYYEYLR